MERKMAASFCFFSGRRRCGSKHDVLTIFLIIELLSLSSIKSVGVYSFLLRSPLQLSPASKLCAAADVDSAPSSKKKRRTFDENYERLKKYNAEHGNCNVPSTYKPDKKLADFVYYVRKRNRAGTLKEDQRVRLDAIGFVYDRQADAWNGKLEKLIAYRKENGHCNVPEGYKPDKKLATFVKYVRRQHRAGLLAEEHREKLDAIGFVYDPLVDTWNKNLEQLITYRKDNGHCIVSTSNRNLSSWVSWIRQTSNMLSESQRKELDSLGFIWTDGHTTWADRLWNEKLERLKAYKVEHGHTRVPIRWDQDKTLGAWVSKQRYQNRKGTLREDRKATLEALGFEWARQNSLKLNTKYDEKWLQQYHKLEEFKARYGHTNTKLGDDPKLGQWVAHQRECYRQGILRKDREEALESLGFQWAIKRKIYDQLWMEKYNCLLEFKDEHGHLEVPNKLNSILYDWCRQQRKRHSNGVLEPDRERLLEDIGFDWDSGSKT